MDLKEAFRILESASANGDDPNYMWSKASNSKRDIVKGDPLEAHPWYFVDTERVFSGITDFFFGVNIK